MSTQAYLIDTNVIIGLEDNHSVKPAFAAFNSIAAKHKVDVFVHKAARDDIARDKDAKRRVISLSKLEKFQSLDKVRGLGRAELESDFGALSRPNDIVDATLLHALKIGIADFLVTEDRGLHDRARRYSAELAGRVLFVADAVQLLKTTYEPIETPIKYVEEALAHTIPLDDDIFDSLREDYPDFDNWWKTKCIRGRRACWVVYDDGLAGLVVRKDETGTDTDATIKAKKILKICTFKVRPEKRGVKLGELLLKKVFWYAQQNKYDLVYITTYAAQVALIDLLDYYGFVHTATKADSELVYEKRFSSDVLNFPSNKDVFTVDRRNYPRFVIASPVRAFGVPIKEAYHDTLYPDLKDAPQSDLFEVAGIGSGPKRPGNTIRKVYLCRSPSNLAEAGSLLLFYKGKAKNPPSQAITAIGILEEVFIARSTKDLQHMTGGRSVYSEADLLNWKATPQKPVKVINYLLSAYIDPPIGIDELMDGNVFVGHPPQSIFEIPRAKLSVLLPRLNLDFKI